MEPLTWPSDCTGRFKRAAIPLLSIVDATCAAVPALGIERVGLIGTRSPREGTNHKISDRTQDDLLRLDVPNLNAIAPIIWARWGSTFLEGLRQESLDAADGLAFVAMNSDGGIRTLLIVCTTNRAQIQTVEQAFELNVITRLVDWESYSAAEMIFKTEKRNGFGHQEMRDGDERTALVLCATRPESVRTLEKLFDLPE